MQGLAAAAADVVFVPAVAVEFLLFAGVSEVCVEQLDMHKVFY